MSNLDFITCACMEGVESAIKKAAKAGIARGTIDKWADELNAKVNIYA